MSARNVMTNCLSTSSNVNDVSCGCATGVGDIGFDKAIKANGEELN